eukprot:SAG11_NODE_14029_length_628_cov_0.924386_1_plen_130_part_00
MDRSWISADIDRGQIIRLFCCSYHSTVSDDHCRPDVGAQLIKNTTQRVDPHGDNEKADDQSGQKRWCRADLFEHELDVAKAIIAAKGGPLLKEPHGGAHKRTHEAIIAARGPGIVSEPDLDSSDSSDEE